ncbi:tyrosine-protein phosphatase non-receptor type 12 isoform X2 [Patella vulgata]|uniref:tyrosine-protein phosphatase non-receptor type 12 isoform X2 n=1 Tax=Patella vulgata TaxID=6465 RepID=UPI0024A9A42B|nr:tyrosine-protein phosphatase non-receptor type 12 isoform X2 [Patella vulgata]
MSSQQRENLECCISRIQELIDEDDPSGDGFTREFRLLREMQFDGKRDDKFPAEEGKKECNIKKNRYKDILPYDYKRVVLKQDDDNNEGSDYINASYIEDVYERDGYIASQGPLPHTVNHFWRMLWQLKIEIVFMACKLEEGHPPKKKCEKYWAEAGEVEEFGNISVTLVEEEEILPDFYRRRLCAKCGTESHYVTQFHYTGWPDHGVPNDAADINKMIHHMRAERKKPDIPLVIHCSAGCGRTGTICGIDYAWTLLNQGKIGKDFSLFDIIAKFREQRQSMVQTPDQYKLVHLVMKNLFEEWIKTYDINNEVDTEQLYYNTRPGKYENVDFEDDYVNTGDFEDDYVNTGDFEEDYSPVDVGNIYTDCDGDAVVVINDEIHNKAVITKVNNTSSKAQEYENQTFIDRRSHIDSTSSTTSTEIKQAPDIYTDVISQDNKKELLLARNKVRKSSHVYENSALIPRNNRGLCYENLDSDFTVRKKEVQKPVMRSSDPVKKESSFPSLPPRNYSEEEAKVKTDQVKSRATQQLPEKNNRQPGPNTSHIVVPGHGTGPRVHRVQPDHVSDPRLVSGYGTGPRVHRMPPGHQDPYLHSVPVDRHRHDQPKHPLHPQAHYQQNPMISHPGGGGVGVHRTVITVNNHHPPQPSGGIRFKMGRKEIAIPIVQQVTYNADPNYNRQFRGNNIGYNQRMKHPNPLRYPDTFYVRRN